MSGVCESRQPDSDDAERWRDELFADALASGQRLRLRVASCSMTPALRPGDFVWVEGQRPRLGEIALARVQGSWVVHRVVAADADGLLLRGDAPGSIAHREPYERIAGRVVGSRRDLSARLRYAVYRLRALGRRIGAARPARGGKSA